MLQRAGHINNSAQTQPTIELPHSRAKKFPESSHGVRRQYALSNMVRAKYQIHDSTTASPLELTQNQTVALLDPPV